ncbi:MAG TPA: AEC family transporter [Deltaproteobacteria bacterium]|nr:AEC family transporter [Deltaproteobacteria bacterium]
MALLQKVSPRAINQSFPYSRGEPSVQGFPQGAVNGGPAGRRRGCAWTIPFGPSPMAFTEVLSVVFPVFSIIGLGYLFASFRSISLEPIMEVLLYLTIPALVISSLTDSPIVTSDLVEVSAVAAAVVAATALASRLYLSFRPMEDRRGFYMAAMFMNSGNMGFPLALLAFGSAGLSVAVVYFIAVSLLVYSVGISIAKGRGGMTEIFRLPLIYAAGTGLVLNLSGLALPAALKNTVDLLGAATIPLMQVSLGYRLYSARVAHLGDSLACTAIRIGVGAAAAWFVTGLFGMGGLNRQVAILASSMPSAVMNFVMTHRYGGRSDLVASTIAVSTVVSVVTTPVVLVLISD